jgi:hypothetical protein
MENEKIADTSPLRARPVIILPIKQDMNNEDFLQLRYTEFIFFCQYGDRSILEDFFLMIGAI